jgi:2-polyprenyl-3-methyl-5-hydroxy-6-metoxy-1,4-benzoquinol methylase
MRTAQDEMEFLESVIDTYVTSDSPQDRVIKTLAVKTFEKFMSRPGHALEYGCCDGFMSSLIAEHCETLTSVDGSKTFIEMAKKRAPKNVEFIHSLFENYRTDRKFDYIFATYVLEHVNDPVEFLINAGSLLQDHGLLFIVVPNARALSRQLARSMGLIDDLYALTQNDLNHGHRRVYDRVKLTRDLDKAGLTQLSQGGLLLKPFADFQMDKLIENGIVGDLQIEGLYKLGLEHPDFCGSLFSVCRRK